MIYIWFITGLLTSRNQNVHLFPAPPKIENIDIDQTIPVSLLIVGSNPINITNLLMFQQRFNTISM